MIKQYSLLLGKFMFIQDFHDIFAYDYTELLDVFPTICQHIISLYSDVIPTQMKLYNLNSKYKELV